MDFHFKAVEPFHQHHLERTTRLSDSRVERELCHEALIFSSAPPTQLAISSVFKANILHFHDKLCAVFVL